MASGTLKVLTLPVYCPVLISGPKVVHIGVQNPKQPQDLYCTLATTAAAAAAAAVSMIITTKTLSSSWRARYVQDKSCLSRAARLVHPYKAY